MKYGGQASTGMLIFCVITSGWGLGLGSVSINLCLSLAPAAFWNPILPTHRGETMTHDLSHCQGCWEWPVTLHWALSESAQSDPFEPHDLSSHSCAWSVLRGRKGTRQMGAFWCKCVGVHVCWCVGMGVQCVWGLGIGRGWPCLCLYVLTYLHPFPLRGPSQGSIYLESGGLPKQRVSYSQGCNM